MDLQNKVAVVNGGVQGLGRAFVELLLKKGSNVVCLHVYKCRRPASYFASTNTNGLQIHFDQVAFNDINEPLGKEFKATLAEEYGPGRVEFYTAYVQSKEEFRGI